MTALEDKIDAVARERARARALGDRVLTDQLGDELDQLYAKQRDRRRDPGSPFTGRSSSFVSMRSRSPRPWRVQRTAR